jgi:hypothetical protein
MSEGSRGVFSLIDAEKTLLLLVIAAIIES